MATVDDLICIGVGVPSFGAEDGVESFIGGIGHNDKYSLRIV
jgi:hypothetical protein